MVGPGVRSIDFRMPPPFQLLEAAATRDLLFSAMDESQRRQVYVMFDHRRVQVCTDIIGLGSQTWSEIDVACVVLELFDRDLFFVTIR